MEVAVDPGSGLPEPLEASEAAPSSEGPDLARAAGERRAQPGSGNHLITVMSPKGGTGKTTIATNLGVTLARRHPGEVVVVDLDLQFGDVGGALRLLPDSTIADIAARWPVDSVGVKLHLTEHHTGLLALCAPEDPAQADDVEPAHVESILALLSVSFRYVIVDSEPGLSEHVLSALDCSTDIAMVCSTDVHSVRGLRKAMRTLDLIGMTAARRHLVINRADAKVNLTIAEIESAVGCGADVLVPSAREIVLAVNEGVPVAETGSPPQVVRAFEQLADRFEEAAAAADSAGGFGRLFRRGER